MVPMTRRTATWRTLLAMILVAGCAGPEPSGSPEGTLAADASPSPLATMASPTIEPTPGVTPADPTLEPTVEPEPTPADAFAPRTEIEINQNVADRPGVPASLRDKYWWTTSDVGSVGTTAQLGLPRGEWVQDAVNARVVSTNERADEQGTDIRVRSFETGAILAEVHTSMRNIRARIASGRLFWTGFRGVSACPPDDLIDGGVWALELQPGSAPVAVVDGGQRVQCGFTGRGLMLSPSRDTLGGIMASGGDPNWIDVIDTSSLTRRTRIQDVWPDAMTDDTFIQWDQRPTDGIGFGLGGMTAYGLADGAVRWRFPGDDWRKFGPGTFLAFASKFYIQYFWDSSPTDVILAIFDPLTGDRQVLHRQTDTREDEDLAIVDRKLSSGSHIALSYTGPQISVAGTSYSVLDVASGNVTWDAFTIDPPWLCSGNQCLRDG